MGRCMVTKYKHTTEEKEVPKYFECDICGDQFPTGVNEEDWDKDVGRNMASESWLLKTIHKEAIGIYWGKEGSSIYDNWHTIIAMIPESNQFKEDMKMDVCPECFKNYIWSLKGMRKGRV
jgi:hypothetical protein